MVASATPQAQICDFKMFIVLSYFLVKISLGTSPSLGIPGTHWVS
jgi:hypothetical protein